MWAISLLILGFLGLIYSEIKVDETQKWRLVFHDEFLGDSLDTSKWEYQKGCSEG